MRTQKRLFVNTSNIDINSFHKPACRAYHDFSSVFLHAIPSRTFPPRYAGVFTDFASRLQATSAKELLPGRVLSAASVKRPLDDKELDLGDPISLPRHSLDITAIDTPPSLSDPTALHTPPHRVELHRAYHNQHFLGHCPRASKTGA